MLEHLRRNVSPDSFDAYCAGLVVRIEDDGNATVLTPTRHARENLEKIFKREIANAIRTAFPSLLDVHFCAKPRAANESSTTVGAVLPSAHAHVNHTPHAAATATLPGNNNGKVMWAALLEPPLSPLYRLENFESGVCNRIACAAAQTVVESPGSVYCPLYLHGDNGLGKTHLLQGIAQGIKERNPAAKVIFTSCEAFANGYIAALQARTLDAFRARFRACDALLIDDIEFLSRTVKIQEELLHTVQYLRNAGKQVVFSAIVAPSELARIEPKLAEVLRSGLSIKLEFPEFELRVKLLHALAKRRSWALDDGAARILALHIEKSVGELEGALCKMVAVSRANGVCTSSELALGALRDLGIVRSGPPTLSDVLEACAKTFGVKADDIRSGKRDASVAHARHIGMYVSRHVTPHTVAEIGRFYGNRDHSTVLHGIRKVTGMAKRDEPIRQQIHQIKQLVGS